MTTLNATDARAKLFSLIREVAESHEPVVIKGKQGNAVLISEEDWNAVSETLYLVSMPGMRESIRDGMETPVENCKESLDW
jgi:prevent-host-death family protein